jgi:hypothetical protein
MVRSLAVAHRGVLAPDSADAHGSQFVQAQASMYRAKHQQAALVAAARAIEPYRAAPDSSIRTSASYLSHAYRAMGDYLASTVTLLRETLDSSNPPRVGEAAEKLATLKLQRDQARDAIAAGIGEGMSALARVDSTGVTTILAISASEREQLIEELHEEFGDALTLLPDSTWASEYASIAAAFRADLADPRWQLRPETSEKEWD